MKEAPLLAALLRPRSRHAANLKQALLICKQWVTCKEERTKCSAEEATFGVLKQNHQSRVEKKSVTH